MTQTNCGTSAVVLFSGGQDSTTCLFWAKERYAKVYALCFRYGQKHATEIEAAGKIAKMAGIKFHILDASFISSLSSCNALVNSSIVMDESKPEQGPPNTFVPGRNMFFIGMAAVFAFHHDADVIVTGVSQTDFSGYPDCREPFILSMNETLNEAMDRQFRIETPLMYLDKAQTWALADSLGVFDLVRTETVTCYNGVKGSGCGHCPACLLRNRGLKKYLKQRDVKTE